MSEASTNEVMTAGEVAQRLRVAERTVHAWASKGILPAAKMGAIWRFRRTEISAWLEQRFSPTGSLAVGLRDVLAPERVLFLSSHTKEAVLDTLIDCLSSTPQVRDPERFRQAIFQREEMMSTGIGLGVGLPHVRLESVTGPIMAVGRCLHPLNDYASLDNTPVDVVFMIATRSDQHSIHIQLLAAISRRIGNNALRQLLAATETTSEYFEILVREPAGE